MDEKEKEIREIKFRLETQRQIRRRLYWIELQKRKLEKIKSLVSD